MNIDNFESLKFYRLLYFVMKVYAKWLNLLCGMHFVLTQGFFIAGTCNERELN